MRDELTRRADGYVRVDVDAWLARALAARRGYYRDPTAREAAAGLLPPVLARVALLAELVRLVPGCNMDQLAIAARLATTEPAASRRPSSGRSSGRSRLTWRPRCRTPPRTSAGRPPPSSQPM
ncbi:MULTISPECIES: hypothetical protein [unclassified Streptomyces]|uniref:hypothetical protein n=1 Tax=unclassified Streptomyces TaxID=2593676 RepID=UPI0033318049